jgi:hypothetical protein
MRYLVTARVKPGREAPLLRALDEGTLGSRSVAGGEYLRDMHDARIVESGTVKWVEVCFCGVPLDEERPYWEEYFDLDRVQDAHRRDRCRDLNETEAWACSDCDCTVKLERHLSTKGERFIDVLRRAVKASAAVTASRSPGDPP